MKRASVREFRSNLADMIDEPVILTRHGRPRAIVYPLNDLKKVPVEIRHEIADATAREFGVAPKDEVAAAYAAGVDRTLIRENLRKTPAERIQALMGLQRLHHELRKK